MSRKTLYRCKECGAIHESSDWMWRHVTNHQPWINWPWNDNSTPLSSMYEMIAVSEFEVMPGYAE